MKNKHRFLAVAAIYAIAFAAALPAHADEPGAYGPGMMRGMARRRAAMVPE